jgi:hypothetical protein
MIGMNRAIAMAMIATKIKTVIEVATKDTATAIGIAPDKTTTDEEVRMMKTVTEMNTIKIETAAIGISLGRATISTEHPDVATIGARPMVILLTPT